MRYSLGRISKNKTCSGSVKHQLQPLFIYEYDKTSNFSATRSKAHSHLLLQLAVLPTGQKANHPL